MAEWTPDYKDSYIRVGTLRAELEKLPDDLLIVLSSDSEGNNYSPLSGFSEPSEGIIYHPDSTYSGEISSQEDRDDPEGWGFSEIGLPALVLWPVN